MSEWISVEDAKPADRTAVIVVMDHGDSKVTDVYYWDRFWSANNVTHWMPLPEPPK
jgi:hypothetical protein